MYCINRLTVIGAVEPFPEQDDWLQRAQGKFPELLESSATRYACQFETAREPPLEFLRQLSLDWPDLIFFLDYDNEEDRFKGLAKAVQGTLENHRFKY